MIGAIQVHQYQSGYIDGTKSYVGAKVGVSALMIQQLIWPSFETNGPNASVMSTKPESTCGVPCRVGEYAVQLAIVCCWRCESCPPDGDVSIRPGFACSTRRVKTIIIIIYLFISVIQYNGNKTSGLSNKDAVTVPQLTDIRVLK